ncbi:hypothetical protein PTSG_05906 [Salpingoeca rosetta]|uniref:Cytidyltransferase-like domain-containing protein n=1 Tax=Salpingoeca rosetta (strain ATCC 50818 / BSB-021) TaxID=946362 RepID=F2UD47_SALR5|nr:uncharacterized protein PTSG_05906 [Salpingoeca rosetta]EGD74542.1 hypothetical protein PTSG_05906 [Salpingoeca rosetta]|eukprot:XP_004992799.1 hypothetical protein PTSG_05906 [Salpingoeca rosetta]
MSIVAVVWRLAEPASVLAASAEARQPLVNTCAQHLQKQLERSGDANAAFRVYLLFDDGQLHARHDVLQICSHIYSSCDANLQAAERYVYDLLVVPISDADEVPLCKRAMLLAPTLSMVYNEPASSDVRALDQERKAVGVAPAAMLERVAHQHDDADREVTAAATRDVQAEARVFDHCCMGGSFDHLHSGHKLLLTAAALHTRTCIHIGITSGKLLANKKHAHLLEAFDAR